ncbi:MAG: hypothetical protein IPN76_26600 [Saprospiraceae bacterium]|nr:hypothetical protein [Saprospiraceae bacterium]
MEGEQTNIDNLLVAIQEKEAALKDAEKKQEGFFEVQAEALDYLLGILLGKRANKSSYYRIESFGRVLEKQPLYSINQEEFYSLVTSGLRDTAVLPQDWRKLLSDVFDQQLPNFSGSFAMPYNNIGANFLKQEPFDLSGIDMATFLSLKMATLHGCHIMAHNKMIALALTGGVLAKINFRKKGKALAKFDCHHSLALFAKGHIDHINSQREDGFQRFVSETLYLQTGYANSELEITLPQGYYILTDRYVIDISFEAAPILFGAEAIARFAPNIAGAAKQKKKQKELDDFWDDDDD